MLKREKQNANVVGVDAHSNSLNQTGITLIALIITIIVMLILVGVTINVALTGGLFTKASDASKQMQIEAEKEELLSSVVAAIGYDGKVVLADIELPTGWTGTNGTYTSPKGNTYTVDENGKITGGSSNPGTNIPEGALITMYRAGENCTVANCTNEEHLHIGDYVSYNPDTDITTYYPDGEDLEKNGQNTGTEDYEEVQVVTQDTLKWRVLGAEENSVLLISETPTQQPIIFLGHVGYNNYETVLNTACSTLYSKSGIGTARSITMRDIDTYLDGDNFEKTTYGAGETDGYYGYTNTITSKYDYNTETKTLTKLPKGQTKNLTLTSNAYNYLAEDYITDPIKLSLLQGDDLDNTPYIYWIASRGEYVDSDTAYWCINYFAVTNVVIYDGFCFCQSDGGENGDGAFLRPIVTLSPNVTVNQVAKEANV